MGKLASRFAPHIHRSSLSQGTKQQQLKNTWSAKTPSWLLQIINSLSGPWNPACCSCVDFTSIFEGKKAQQPTRTDSERSEERHARTTANETSCTCDAEHTTIKTSTHFKVNLLSVFSSWPQHVFIKHASIRGVTCADIRPCTDGRDWEEDPDAPCTDCTVWFSCSLHCLSRLQCRLRWWFQIDDPCNSGSRSATACGMFMWPQHFHTSCPSCDVVMKTYVRGFHSVFVPPDTCSQQQLQLFSQIASLQFTQPVWPSNAQLERRGFHSLQPYIHIYIGRPAIIITAFLIAFLIGISRSQSYGECHALLWKAF